MSLIETKAGDIYRGFRRRWARPKEGDLRVCWFAQVPCKSFDWPVANLAEAALLLDALSCYDDHQFAINVKGDYSNAGGLLVYRNGDWEDWESEDRDGFDTWRETEEGVRALQAR